ncbi:MAG: ATP synthase F0 subunit B [Planctomycetaceae bacterium]
MTLRHQLRTAGLLACLLLWGAGMVQAEAAHAEPASAATHPDADHPVGDEGDHRDFNQPPLQIDRRMGELFVFSLLLFGAFVLAARSMVWKPLISALDERESRVNQAHAAAELAKSEAERLLAEHSSRMSVAHEQVQQIVTAARKEAEQEKARIIAEAEARAKRLRDEAIADIEAARDHSIAELSSSLDAEVERAATQVFGV